MRPLRPGDEAQVQWSDGTLDCRVLAAAGLYVLLRPLRAVTAPMGACALTYVDGMVPVGWDGWLEAGSRPDELRFRVTDARVADRRNSVRIPVSVPVRVVADGTEAGGEVLDVSAGGMRLRRTGRIAAGTTIQIHAEIPGGPVIDADAIVRASEPGICAVEYVAMRGASSADIGAWTVDVLRHHLAAA
jgi:hypothetical protein